MEDGNRLVAGLERLAVLFDRVAASQPRGYRIDLQTAYLLRAACRPEGAFLAEFKQATGLSDQRASQLASQLVRKGLALTNRDKNRRRFKSLYATSKGREFLRKRDAAIRKSIASQIGRGQQARRIEKKLADRVAEAIEAISPATLFDDVGG